MQCDVLYSLKTSGAIPSTTSGLPSSVLMPAETDHAAPQERICEVVDKIFSTQNHKHIYFLTGRDVVQFARRALEKKLLSDIGRHRNECELGSAARSLLKRGFLPADAQSAPRQACRATASSSTRTE